MAKTVDREARDGQLSPKDVGRQLRQVRRKQGLSRGEVARSAGLTRRELAAYERGRIEVPESDLWCLAGSCGVDVGELLPQRAPAKVSSDLSLLAVGDSIRYLRSPVDNDELLREYMSMIYELRNVAPGSRVPLRERDLMALADALGGSPETIESRLIELIGVSHFEAARLRQMILPAPPEPPALLEGAPMPAPHDDVYGELGTSTDGATDAQVVDFFSAPRSSDPFEPPPPPPPQSAVAAWEVPTVPTDAPSLPADPFSAMPDTSVVASASFDAPVFEPLAESAEPDDTFGTAFDPLESSTFPTYQPSVMDPADSDPVIELPTSDIWTTAPEADEAVPLAWSSDLVDTSFSSVPLDAASANMGAVDPTFANPTFASPSFTDATFTDATLANATFTDPTVTDAPLMARPLPTTELPQPELAPIDIGLTDLTPINLTPIDIAPLAPIDSIEPLPPIQPLAPAARDLAEVLDAEPAFAPQAPDDVAPIAWVARADLDEAPHAPTTGNGSSNGFVRAGSNWRIGGIFPATAAADDGTLALRRADARWALADLQAPGDFTVEAVVDFTAGVGFGVLFRATIDDTDRISGYSFDIDPIAGGGGYLLRQWVDNKQHWQPLAQASVTDPSRLFGRHLVVVTLRADQLSVLVDGEAALALPSLTRMSVDLGQAPCRGAGVGVQAWATTEVTIESFRVARS